MYVLGINIFSHDSSAVLLKDNKIICAIEEERLNRIKHYSGFPKLAISKCLEIANIKIEDVDVISSDGIDEFSRKQKIKNFIRLNYYEKAIRELKFLKGPTSVETTRKYLKDNGFKFDSEIKVFDHHQCHAASAFFTSGFKNATVVTADAKGFYTTQTVWEGNNNKINLTDIQLLPNSPGYIYKYITYKCGFGSFAQGTTMALAPYGKPILKEKIEKLTPFIEKWTDIMNLIETQDNVPVYDDNDLLKITYSKLNSEEKIIIDEIEKAKKEDLAASVQTWLEEHIKNYILKNKIKNTKNLVLAGGTFLNCVLNSKLKKKYFENVFIQPAAGDSGIALGAAILANTNIPLEKMNHTYFGPEFDNKYIEKMLKNKKIEYIKSDEIQAAKLIAKGNIVGWFQGKMEFGPRALGNRSILSDPSNLITKERLNNEVKHRESFRPYAASILSEKMDDYFEDSCSSPFMIMTFNVKKEKKSIVPAIIHIDGSSRVQSVDKKINPKYHNLISEFFKLKKIPLILNTSFNRRGEPIVYTPEEALDTFLNTGIDYLFLNNYLVSKNES